MNKRITEIITFPFYLIYLLISFPFKILRIVLDDRKGKKESDSSININSNSNIKLSEIGKLLFPNKNSEFKIFLNSFLTDNKKFLSENQKVLKDYGNFEIDKLKVIEAIYIFGDSKELVYMTDWKGEENEREIEFFFETKLKIVTDWNNTKKLRQSVIEEKQRDGKFIVNLFNAIDKDFESLNKKLIFFDLGWDSYIYTAIDITSYKIINIKFGSFFHGTEKLNK